MKTGIQRTVLRRFVSIPACGMTGWVREQVYYTPGLFFTVFPKIVRLPDTDSRTEQ